MKAKSLWTVALFATAASLASAQGVLTNGQNHTGAITLPQQTQNWTFAATAGEVLILRLAEQTDNNGFVPYLRLYRPDGSLASGDWSNQVTEVGITANQTGTYTAAVSSNDSRNTGTGTYRLTLAKSTGAFVVPAGDEGGPMTNGGNHSGALQLGDLDMWSFEATAGESITLRIGELVDNNVMVPYLRLYRPDGIYMSGDWSNQVTDVSVSASQTGTYLVVVSTNDSQEIGTGTYRLTLAKAGGTFIVPSDDEGGPMTNGQNHTGTIHLGDVDMWSFQATSGESISLRIGELVDNNVMVPYLRLYRPDGSAMSGDWSNQVTDVSVTANQTGVYTVLVTTNDSQEVGTGTYRITLAKSPGAFVVPEGDEGGPMTNGQNHTGTLHLGDLDMWSFQASAGDSISIRIGELVDNNVMVPYLRLYRPDGSHVSGDWSNQVTDLSVTANQTGIYIVLVTTNDSQEVGTGTYRLTLARTPGAFVVPPGDDGGPMTNGQNHTGTLHLGDLDMWTFDATAGESLSIRIGELVDNNVMVPYLRLYRPDGSHVSGDWSNQVTDISVAAPQTGTYTVLVTTNDSQEIGTGTYRITLAKSPGAFIVPSQDEGGPLTVGSNNTGSIHLGDLDMWTLQATAGERITLSINEIADQNVLVPYIRLYRPDGSHVSSDWGNASASLNVTASQTGTYTLLVTTNDSQEIGTGSYRITSSHSGPPLQPPPTVSSGPFHYNPVTPCRIIDTRNAPGVSGGPSLASQSIRDVEIPATSCGIPATATAYALNVVVVPKGPLGYLSIWPAGTAQPVVATLTSLDGRIKANAALVPAGAGGAVSLYVTDETDVVIDINGYFTPPGPATALQFYPLPPCRLMDTRGAAGMLGGPALPADTPRNVPVLASSCGVPPSARAYSLNATVVPDGPFGFLTLWPTGSPQPLAATLNALTGTVTANAAIIPAGAGGSIEALGNSRTHLILDINGYFAPPGSAGALSFYTLQPCRVSDTRLTPDGPFAGPAQAAGAAREYPMGSSECAGLTGAAAYSLNATVVPDGPLEYLTLWPSGQAFPSATTLNALDGAITSNAAIVAGGGTGMSIQATGHARTHLILDINGVFRAP